MRAGGQRVIFDILWRKFKNDRGCYQDLTERADRRPPRETP